MEICAMMRPKRGFAHLLEKLSPSMGHSMGIEFEEANSVLSAGVHGDPNRWAHKGAGGPLRGIKKEISEEHLQKFSSTPLSHATWCLSLLQSKLVFQAIR
eukprot:1157416-Pelagomonas_calceolata.AAC.5